MTRLSALRDAGTFFPFSFLVFLFLRTLSLNNYWKNLPIWQSLDCHDKLKYSEADLRFKQAVRLKPLETQNHFAMHTLITDILTAPGGPS
jgi:hypothetical protein